jgi:hypothetical protein
VVAGEEVALVPEERGAAGGVSGERDHEQVVGSACGSRPSTLRSTSTVSGPTSAAWITRSQRKRARHVAWLPTSSLCVRTIQRTPPTAATRSISPVAARGASTSTFPSGRRSSQAHAPKVSSAVKPQK